MNKRRANVKYRPDFNWSYFYNRAIALVRNSNQSLKIIWTKARSLITFESRVCKEKASKGRMKEYYWMKMGKYEKSWANRGSKEQFTYIKK